jgi:hypothetical protein
LGTRKTARRKTNVHHQDTKDTKIHQEKKVSFYPWWTLVLLVAWWWNLVPATRLKGTLMAFDKAEVEQLLVDCGRRCCICGQLQRVQVHHIVPGNDNIENGIPLRPNCHDGVHTEYSPGKTTRTYTLDELRGHRKRTIDQVKREGKWKPGVTLTAYEEG